MSEGAMHFNDAQAERITDHQVCVVYDKKTGTIAHIHQSITFEGAEAPTKEQFEARAKEFAREFAEPPTGELEPRARKLAGEFAAKFRGIKLDRLDVLHVKPDQFTGQAMKVDTRSQRLVPVASKRSAPRKAKRRAKSRKP
ncbi:MAG: hypothetical protein WAM06_05195 [Methyloceanibacter sp.]|jgi:hypothetical protein